MPAPASAKSAGEASGDRAAGLSATSTLIQPLHNRFPTPRQPSGTSTNLHPSFNRHATASQSQPRLICLTITFQPPESAKRTIPRLANTHDSTILRVEYKNDTISTKPSYISDSPTPTDAQKQKTEDSALTPLQALQKNGKIPMLQFWETWRYSLLKFRTIYRALV